LHPYVAALQVHLRVYVRVEWLWAPLFGVKYGWGNIGRELRRIGESGFAHNPGSILKVRVVSGGEWLQVSVVSFI
jgi:hypothetical protein